ncbi:MAG TPA: YdeI/OmpD-associated family protein [Myxococcales bacterium]|jgi:uncharacterized protein YdeI (YjbR/CyaY-like superfamily)
MGKKDPRVDAYIDGAPPFAKPILDRFRTVMHEACPDVDETVRWGVPSFDHHGILANMAAFKAHCRLVFWKEALLPGAETLGQVTEAPAKAFLAKLVKQAAKLNEEGVAVPKEPKGKKPAPKVPDDLAAALKKNAKARAGFEKLSPSHQREYIEWISGAKREETRQKRIATTVAQAAEGKSQNAKYAR